MINLRDKPKFVQDLLDMGFTQYGGVYKSGCMGLTISFVELKDSTHLFVFISPFNDRAQVLAHSYPETLELVRKAVRSNIENEYF